MKRYFWGLSFLILFLLNSCSNNPATPTSKNDPGSANITVSLGKVGALAKKADISFVKLCIRLSAPDVIPIIYDTIPISGNGQTSVSKTYDNLASLKTWTLTASSLDLKDSVIHSGSTTFKVLPRQTVTVPVLNLSALYSMLKANFFPIRDSVTSCKVLVDGNKVADSSFAKQSLLGDTVKLAFDYLKTITPAIKFE